jgi:hypothetical protein
VQRRTCIFKIFQIQSLTFSSDHRAIVDEILPPDDYSAF